MFTYKDKRQGKLEKTQMQELEVPLNICVKVGIKPELSGSLF